MGAGRAPRRRERTSLRGKCRRLGARLVRGPSVELASCEYLSRAGGPIVKSVSGQVRRDEVACTSPADIEEGPASRDRERLAITESPIASQSFARVLPRAGDRLRGRFELLSELGAGSSGVVFLARDEVSGSRVALKVLRSASWLSRLKSEHRHLRSVAHPHLVTSLELFAEEAPEFIIMPFVPGRHLDRVLLEGRAAARLPTYFRQLAEALHALHRAELVHRDLKPSNVLVSEEGVVRLIDFGLVLPISEVDAEPLGTPAYAAPECVRGERATAMSDWYSFGVMLYQALDGRLPFEGTVVDVLRRKCEEDPPPLRGEAAASYPELSRLALKLLSRQPHLRPGLLEIARVFEFVGSTHDVHERSAAIFVGRQGESRRLSLAYERSLRGQAEVVEVVGPSGIGKTSLVRELSTKLAADSDEPLVLTGTCYEHETISHNVLDEVIQRLATSEAHVDARAALSRGELGVMARTFPHFAGSAEGESTDDGVLDGKAPLVGTVFGRLVARVSLRRPVVMVLDQLQWADADSARLLSDAWPELRGARVFLVLICRDDERASSEFLRLLEAERPEMLRERLVVPPLSEDEGRELVRRLGGVDAPELLSAAGNPMVLTLFSRGDASLHALDREARELGGWIALAGHPVETTVLRAAFPEARDLPAVVRRLETGSWIRSVWRRGAPMLTASHDWTRARLREGLTTEMACAGHLRLAEALRRSPSASIEEVAEHYYHAGAWEQMVPLARRVADRAQSSHAFSNEAKWLDRLLEAPAVAPAERRRWAERAARALGDAGRGREAATRYAALALRSEGDEAIGLRIRAAEQLFRSGARAAGFVALRPALERVEARVPRSDFGAFLGLLAVRARLRLRRLEIQSGAPCVIDARARLALEALSVAKSGYISSDFVRAAFCAGRSLELALDAREPNHVLRALSDELLLVANEGTRSRKRIDYLLRCIDRLVPRVRDPDVLVLSDMALGAARLFLGDFGAPVPVLRRVEEQLVARPHMKWELDYCRMLLIIALQFHGGLAFMGSRLDDWIADAEARGDSASVAHFLPKRVWAFLARDRTAEARGVYEKAAAQLGGVPRARMDQAKISLLNQRAYLCFYEGASREELVQLRAELQGFFRSPIRRSQGLRVTATVLDAGLSLVLRASAGNVSTGEAREFERTLRRLRAERAGYATAFAELLEAASEHQRGRHSNAVRLLSAASRGLRDAGHELAYRSAQLRLGELRGDGPGRELIAAAEARFLELGIVSPARFANVHAPGFLATSPPRAGGPRG